VTGSPWLPLNADWHERNVDRLTQTPASMLDLHRQLLSLRRMHPALAVGTMALIEAEGDVVAYERRAGDDRLLIALNLGDASQELDLPAWAHHAHPLLSTASGDPRPARERISLRPNEGIILAPPRTA